MRNNFFGRISSCAIVHKLGNHLVWDFFRNNCKDTSWICFPLSSLLFVYHYFTIIRAFIFSASDPEVVLSSLDRILIASPLLPLSILSVTILEYTLRYLSITHLFASVSGYLEQLLLPEQFFYLEQFLFIRIIASKWFRECTVFLSHSTFSTCFLTRAVPNERITKGNCRTYMSGLHVDLISVVILFSDHVRFSG